MGETRPRIAGEVIPGPGRGALLLLHSLALDRTVFDQHIPELIGTCTIVRCDLPGHGRSAPVASITVEQMADDIAAYLDLEGIADASVVGMSLGGTVAQSLAIRHPERVSALGLFDTTAWYGETGPQSWTDRANQASEHGLSSLADFQLDRWFTPQFRVSHSELCDRLLAIFQANDIGSYLATCRALGEVNLLELLGQITAPTFVAVGEFDGATPVDSARAITDRIPRSELSIIESASHLSPLEKPEEFLATVRKLLAISDAREET